MVASEAAGYALPPPFSISNRSKKEKLGDFYEALWMIEGV
jgi:hypothetical protein